MASEPRPRPLRSRALVALLAVALTVAACDGGAPTPNEPAAQAAAADEAEARLVRTVAPEPGTLRATRSASARVQAVRDASVASGASARVVEILARPGDRVEADQIVIRLDDAQAALQLRNAQLAVRQAEVDLDGARRSSVEGASQARASLQAAESNVRSLEDRVQEVRALVEAGGVARTELSALETQLDQARAQLVQARDAVARAERSEGEDLALLELRLEQARVQAEQAREALADSEVRAPFAGDVAELYLELGEFAGTGQPAFRLVSAFEREAVFDVSPEDAQRLLERHEVTLRYAGRDVVAELAGSVRPAQQERLVQLTARIEGEDAAAIPTGALAEVRYEVALADGSLLPSGAVSAEAGATWVYLVRDGVATRVPVDVRAEAGATAAVDGLAPDERVIYPRPLDVREGTRVRTEP